MRPLLSTLLLMILACGGSAVPDATGYSDKLATFQGHSINDAIRVIGAPARTTNGAAGHTFYVWEFRHDVQTDKIIREERDPNGAQQYRVSGGETIPITCTVTMQADAAGLVVHTSAKGPACLVGWVHPGAGAAPPVAPVVAPPQSPVVVAPPATTPSDAEKAVVPAENPSGDGPRTLTPNHSGPPESATEKDTPPRRLAPVRPMPKQGGKLEKH